MKTGTDTQNQLQDALSRGEAPARIAELVRAARGYRWVGLYAVGKTEISASAWTGVEAPSFPRFPVSQGLCGAAVQSRAPVVVGDVRTDSRYLTTFGSTCSEIVVPVMDGGGKVLGLIDVEGEKVDAFTDDDEKFLQDCARALLALFDEARRT